MNKFLLLIFLLVGACSKKVYFGNREFYSSEINKQYDLGVEGFRVEIIKGTIDEEGLKLKGKIYDSADRPINGLPIRFKQKDKISYIVSTNDKGEFLVKIEDITENIYLIFGGNEIYMKREFSILKILTTN